MAIPADYSERVYAGVLGKIIGVYLGRPFEGWTYERIMQELGEIQYYVHERLRVPLIVTDDDISGTFTFLRALADYDYSPDLTPAQIGQTWLNYIIQNKTILWWGGRSNSTEHTAYLNLRNGIEAPHSGSIALNSKVVAEQIGSQIFIDGWAMVAPGDPELAADLARRAGSVSHDGEAIYGAQVLAAMEAQAYVDSNINNLIDCAVSFIPHDSTIFRLIEDIRGWHAKEKDWRKTREQIAARYGYDKYGGNCHMVPNHALIIHSLLHGEDDFQKSLMIVNTSGWDTDCNSGNVGCLLGIKNGLAGIDAGPDFRGPVADRLYLPTADGGRAISDAVTETYHVVNAGRRLAGLEPEAPKGGARYHFELQGAVQGFMPEDSIETRGTATVENVAGHSQRGTRSLAVHFSGVCAPRAARVATPTFIPSEEIGSYFDKRGYKLICSPALYAGQTVEAVVEADAINQQAVQCNLHIRVFGENDSLTIQRAAEVTLKPGHKETLRWQIGDTGGSPIAEVGIEISSKQRTEGTVYLDYLTWSGSPNVTFRRPDHKGRMWRRAWVDGLDFEGWLEQIDWWPDAYRIVQNEGRGILSQGTREWTDYQVSAGITPHMFKAGGIGARVQGMQRYYALLMGADSKVRLVKMLDGEKILAEADFTCEMGSSRTYELTLKVNGNHLTGLIDGQQVLEYEDSVRPLTGGAIALVCDEGRFACTSVRVNSLD
ncbi:MAG: ADP-ribosylglycohydrolase family protein [Anaerolineae bacterium]